MTSSLSPYSSVLECTEKALEKGAVKVVYAKEYFRMYKGDFKSKSKEHLDVTWNQAQGYLDTKQNAHH
jgi:hypothetical protein